MALKEGQLTKRIRNNHAGGVNLYLGPRQIKDNESPSSINCDFKGRGGIGNRPGYTEVGSVADSRTKIFGMSEFHTSSLDYAIKFASNGSNIALYHSTGGAWTGVTGTTFAAGLDVDVCQAGGALYSGNGSNVMRQWSGTTWSATSGGTIGYYPTYYDKRIWVVDETDEDTLNFSGQYGTALGDFGHASAGTVTIRPGSGAKIRGLKVFKNALYIFLTDSIYRLSPASTANTFTVELVTNSVGCVSHRSIDQVGEDLYFAADDGIYSLGEVANYNEVRSTNKSAKVQEVFDALTGANKRKLVGRYFDFKYHLFYSLFGTSNDSCLIYDTRYQGWQDWRNIAANDATKYTDANDDIHFYFGEPTTGEVHEMYSGTTDNGTAISSIWYSKSFDEDVPDEEKLFLDTTFVFGDLGSSLTASVIFDDSEVSATKTVSQTKPQGGFGRDAFGVKAFGDATQNITVTQVINQPQRMRAKGQKFAIQYKVASSGQWQLDAITQTMIPFGHYKFPSTNKLN